jgi:hypothetical protein
VTQQTDRIAEYVQEREDALEGAVAMLDRACAVFTPEREPETARARNGPGLRNSRGGTRTPDPPVNSRLLYQLSYSGMTAEYR